MSTYLTEKAKIAVLLKDITSVRQNTNSTGEEQNEGSRPNPNDRAEPENFSFPKRSLIGLAGSCISILLSWAFVIACKGQRQWPDEWSGVAAVLTPAAILSAIASVNGIFLYIAFTNMTNMAWWLYMTTSRVTINSSHNRRLRSSSRPGAVRTYHRIGEVALTTTFIAIMLISSIILQGALKIHWTSVPRSPIAVSLPFTSKLPYDFSGTLSQYDYSFDGVNPVYGNFAHKYFTQPNKGQIVIDTNVTTIAARNPDYIYDLENYPAVNYELFPEGCDDKCSIVVPGFGFEMQCSNSSFEPRFYDFVVMESDPNWRNYTVVQSGLPIYNVSFSWEPTKNPSTIQFYLSSKADPSCSGTYKQLRCNLTAVQTTYPALVQTRQMIGPDQSATLLSLSSRAEDGGISFGLPYYTYETGAMSTMFGALAQTFNEVFGNSLTLQATGDIAIFAYVFNQHGVYANPFSVAFGPEGKMYPNYTLNTALLEKEGCQTRINDEMYPLESDAVAIMNAINEYTFYLSYSQGNYMYQFPGNYPEPEYKESPLTHYYTTYTTAYRNGYVVVWWPFHVFLGINLGIFFCIVVTTWILSRRVRHVEKARTSATLVATSSASMSSSTA